MSQEKLLSLENGNISECSGFVSNHSLLISQELKSSKCFDDDQTGTATIVNSSAVSSISSDTILKDSVLHSVEGLPVLESSGLSSGNSQNEPVPLSPPTLTPPTSTISTTTPPSPSSSLDISDDASNGAGFEMADKESQCQKLEKKLHTEESEFSSMFSESQNLPSKEEHVFDYVEKNENENFDTVEEIHSDERIAFKDAINTINEDETINSLTMQNQEEMYIKLKKNIEISSCSNSDILDDHTEIENNMKNYENEVVYNENNNKDYDCVIGSMKTITEEEKESHRIKHESDIVTEEKIEIDEKETEKVHEASSERKIEVSEIIRENFDVNCELISKKISENDPLPIDIIEKEENFEVKENKINRESGEKNKSDLSPVKDAVSSPSLYSSAISTISGILDEKDKNLKGKDHNNKFTSSSEGESECNPKSSFHNEDSEEAATFSTIPTLIDCERDVDNNVENSKNCDDNEPGNGSSSYVSSSPHHEEVIPSSEGSDRNSDDPASDSDSPSKEIESPLNSVKDISFVSNIFQTDSQTVCDNVKSSKESNSEIVETNSNSAVDNELSKSEDNIVISDEINDVIEDKNNENYVDSHPQNDEYFHNECIREEIEILLDKNDMSETNRLDSVIDTLPLSTEETNLGLRRHTENLNESEVEIDKGRQGKTFY